MPVRAPPAAPRWRPGRGTSPLAGPAPDRDDHRRRAARGRLLRDARLLGDPARPAPPADVLRRPQLGAGPGCGRRRHRRRRHAAPPRRRPRHRPRHAALRGRARRRCSSPRSPSCWSASPSPGAGVSWAVVGYFTAMQLRTPAAAPGARELGGRRARRRPPDGLDRARGGADRRRRLPGADRRHVGCDRRPAASYLATAHLPPPSRRARARRRTLGNLSRDAIAHPPPADVHRRHGLRGGVRAHGARERVHPGAERGDDDLRRLPGLAGQHELRRRGPRGHRWRTWSGRGSPGRPAPTASTPCSCAPSTTAAASTQAHGWFERYGTPAVFFARLLPVVRTFISLPGGRGPDAARRASPC